MEVLGVLEKSMFVGHHLQGGIIGADVIRNNFLDDRTEIFYFGHNLLQATFGLCRWKLESGNNFTHRGPIGSEVLLGWRLGPRWLRMSKELLKGSGKIRGFCQIMQAVFVSPYFSSNGPGPV